MIHVDALEPRIKGKLVEREHLRGLAGARSHGRIQGPRKEQQLLQCQAAPGPQAPAVPGQVLLQLPRSRRRLFLGHVRRMRRVDGIDCGGGLIEWGVRELFCG